MTSVIFKTAAFNHSATSPSPRKSLWLLRFLRNWSSHEVSSDHQFLTISHARSIARLLESSESASRLTASLATPSIA